MSDEESLKQAAYELGFGLAAIAPCSPPPHADKLDEWLEAGYAGGMLWMKRNPALRKDPRIYWKDTRSILVVGMNYYQPPLPDEILDNPSRGIIASYARGNDYHDVIGNRLNTLARMTGDLLGRPVKTRVLVDTGPLLEKPTAAASSDGFIGKNSLLVQAALGSWFFLGEILLDTELTPDTTDFQDTGCGDCDLCSVNCPTGALDKPYVNNASKCISYLTIEHKGPIPHELRPLIGNRIYGCDDCQVCCPFNRQQTVTKETEFICSDPDRIAPKLLEFITMNREQFRMKFRGSIVKRTGYVRLIRNAVIATGNWGSPEATDALACLMNAPEPLIRGHAAWAMGCINERKVRKVLETSVKREENEYVQDEIRLALK